MGWTTKCQKKKDILSSDDFGVFLTLLFFQLWIKSLTE